MGFKKAIVRCEDYSFCCEGLVLGCIEFGSSQITLILQDLSGLSRSTIFTFMYCSNTRRSLAVRQMFWYFLEMVAFVFCHIRRFCDDVHDILRNSKLEKAVYAFFEKTSFENDLFTESKMIAWSQCIIS